MSTPLHNTCDAGEAAQFLMCQKCPYMMLQQQIDDAKHSTKQHRKAVQLEQCVAPTPPNQMNPSIFDQMFHQTC